MLNDVDLLQRVNENTIRTSVPVSVSTRGIGFGLTTTYRALTNYGDARPPSIYDAYRVGLYVLEAKAQSLEGKCLPLGDDLAPHGLVFSRPASFYQQARTVSGLLKIIQATIDAVGFVEKADVTYRPVIPAPSKHG